MATKRVNVSLKLQALRARLRSLTPAVRAPFARQLNALLARANASYAARRAVGPSSKSVAVAGATAPAAVASSASTDWDLALANELDRIYTAVSDRATEARHDALNAASSAVSDHAPNVGVALWPLALAAVAFAWAYARTRKT